jgi:hypothetical protein
MDDNLTSDESLDSSGRVAAVGINTIDFISEKLVAAAQDTTLPAVLFAKICLQNTR